MSILDQLASGNLLSWFKSISQSWGSKQPASSPTPAPNSSTPADKTPAATVAASASETGEALVALLDLIGKR